MKALTKKLVSTITGIITVVSLAGAVLADNPPAVVVQPPVPVQNLRDDGAWHELVTPGTAEGGFMQYSIDGVTWFSTIPAATAIGHYTVFYRAAGDANHSMSSVGSVNVDITRPDAEAFAEHIYMNALGRHASDQEKLNFVNSINGGANPADIVRAVFSSGEFQCRNLNDFDFINTVYATLCRRTPDSSGRISWTNALQSGLPRMSMVEQVISSYEFADTCLVFGMSRGGNAQPNTTVSAGTSVRNFVGRLYRLCLGRTPDGSGSDYWSSQLQNHVISGTNCAYGFFFSREFINAGYSNNEYVTRLYRVMLGREPDAAGLANWLDALNRGASRQDVFYGFAHSAEFTRICAEYGIVRG